MPKSSFRRSRGFRHTSTNGRKKSKPQKQRKEVKMRYPAQSDIWRLDHVIRPTNGASGGTSLVNHGQSRVLGRFRQIFPLSLFCDDLIIEELRIVHVKKNGPWAYGVISIMATDIASVNASSGLFFGQVHVKSLTGGPEIFVDNMLRRHIYRIRSLV